MISNIYNAMKKGEWGEFYDHSKNHTLEETIKKLTSEEMLDQSEEIIKYVQNYGFFDFVRIEKTSHDVTVCRKSQAKAWLFQINMV